MQDNIPFFVPFNQNPHFVGRAEDLARLHAALQGDQAVGIIPAGITGLGGVGKTQLAVRYAYNYAEHYPDGVYWLTAVHDLDKVFADFGQQLWQIMPYRQTAMASGSLATLARLVQTLFDEEELNSLCYSLSIEPEDVPDAGLARAQNLVALLQRQERLTDLTAEIEKQRPRLVNRPQDELIRLAFAYLHDNPRSLLILDNLPDPAVLHQPVRRDWIPANIPGRLLFTTRRRDMTGCYSLELTVLPEPAALELLLRHPGRRAAFDPAHADHQTARQICALLGYLPLALEVAGAHLGQHDKAPIAQYLAELHQRGAFGVLDDPRLPFTPAVHAAGVRAVLDSQFISLLRSEAQMLLRVAGLFPEAALIPAARLGLLAGLPEEGESFFDVTLDQALGDLENASLIEELKEGQVRLHPLVREYARGMVMADAGEKKFHARFFVSKLAQAYEQFTMLERQCARRAIDAVQEDLLAALELIAPDVEMRVEPLGIPPWRKATPSPVQPWEEPAYDLPERLRMLLRLVQQEAHNLRGWQPQVEPLRFKQQVLYRAFDLSFKEMRLQVEQQLHDGSDYLAPLWCSKQDSVALERTLVGHSIRVSAVAATLDGRRAISASLDETLKVWDLQTGQEIHTLRGHSSWVNAVAATPDGQRAISASLDKTLKVWDLQTGQEIHTLRGHSGGVNAVAAIPDGRRVISASDDQTLKVWDLQTGQELQTLHALSGEVSAVAVTPDGQQAISASQDQALRVWDLQAGRVEYILRGHLEKINAVAVTPDGRRAISASQDQTLKVWDLQTGQEERTLRGHSHWVKAIAVTPDGQRAISASSDLTLRVWDVRTGHEERALRGHSREVLAVAITPDGQRIISASEDRTLKLWDISTPLKTGPAGREVEHPLLGHSAWVSAVAVTPDGQRVISASGDQTLKVRGLQSGQEERTLSGHSGSVWAMAIAPDGQQIISAADDQTLKVWDLQTGQEERTLHSHSSDWVWAIAITPDGKRAITVEYDGTMKVWDFQTWQEERTLQGHLGLVKAVTVTPDGQHAVSGGYDQAVKVWDLQTGEEVCTLSGHLGIVTAVAVSPDGQLIVSASEDRTLKVWDLQTGQEMRALNGHSGIETAIVVTPDGQRVVSASDDHTLMVLDLQTGRETASVILDGLLSCVAVAPDSVTIVTGDGAGYVYCLRYVVGK